jgi:hypothetical protein
MGSERSSDENNSQNSDRSEMESAPSPLFDAGSLATTLVSSVTRTTIAEPPQTLQNLSRKSHP